jgi:Asp-tRNA(Asn)/Glu-tRNA(Gln) amidotransferase A subunit family amidase
MRDYSEEVPMTTTTTTELALQPATELTSALRRGQIGSRELMSHYLERIERLNSAINAVVTLDETALDRADQADAALACGETLGPLHGLPITIKDYLETAGLPTRLALRSTHRQRVLPECVREAPGVACLARRGEGFGRTRRQVVDRPGHMSPRPSRRLTRVLGSVG